MADTQEDAGPQDERPTYGPGSESPWAWQRWLVGVPVQVSAFVLALVFATGVAAAMFVVLVRPPSRAWPIAAAMFAVTLVVGTVFFTLASQARGLSAKERRAVLVAYPQRPTVVLRSYARRWPGRAARLCATGVAVAAFGAWRLAEDGTSASPIAFVVAGATLSLTLAVGLVTRHR